MLRKPKRASRPPLARPGLPADPASAARAPRFAPRRLWLFRVAALALAPLLALGALELGLRLGGFGYSTAFFVPAEVHGRRALIPNERFGWRFFGPELSRSPFPAVLSPKKAPNTRRIFVLGESAAFGDPQPAFGLARMLEILLQSRRPESRFEVVNVSMTAVNSHALLPVARDCARLEGDVWVVYMGNNEVVGPFGAGTVFGPQAPSLALIRASLALKATRTGQLLERALASFRPRPPAGAWGGLAMFLEQRIRPADPRMTSVYAAFQRNLDDLIRTGLRSNARIVVSTVAGNLRDCAPFGSLHRAGLASAEQTEWERLYRAGMDAQEAGRLEEALGWYRQAEAIDPEFAELQYRWAHACLPLGQIDEARRRFLLARERDTLRFRPDHRINEIVRQTVKTRESEGVAFVDGEAVLAGVSPQGLLGRETLYEHVHLTFEGNYTLARALAEQIEHSRPPVLAQGAGEARPWLSLADCARALGWTAAAEHEALAAIHGRLEDPPFTTQADHAQQLQRLRSRMEELLPAQQPEGLRQALEICAKAAQARPDDWVLRQNLARAQQKAGDTAGALASWKRVVELVPQHGEAARQTALLLAQTQRGSEALAVLEETLRRDPRDALSMIGLAQALDRQGKPDQARRLYERALALQPHQGLAHLGLGLCLEAAGDKAQAEVHFRAALQNRMLNSRALIELGRLCLSRGWLNEAATNFTDALRLDPTDTAARVGLGRTLASQGRFPEAAGQYEQAVRLNPASAEARFRLGFERGRAGKDAEALEQFAEAARLDPAMLEARLNLGIALANAQRLKEAETNFQAALAISPTNATALKWLDTLRARRTASPQ